MIKKVFYSLITHVLPLQTAYNTEQEPNPYTQRLMLINYILQPCEDIISTYTRHPEIKDLSPIINLLAVNVLFEDPLG